MTTYGWNSISASPHFTPWEKPASYNKALALYNNARIIATPRIAMWAGVQYYSSGSAFYLRFPPVPGNLYVYMRVKNTTSITNMGRYYPTSTGWTLSNVGATTSWSNIGLWGANLPWIVPCAYVAAGSAWPDTYGTWAQLYTYCMYEGDTYGWPSSLLGAATTPAQVPRIGMPLGGSTSGLSAVEYNALVDAAEQALYLPQFQWGLGNQSGYQWELATQLGNQFITGYVEFDPAWDHRSQDIVIVAFIGSTSSIELTVTVGGCPLRLTETLLYGYLHVYRGSWFNKPVIPAMYMDQRPRYAMQIQTPGKSTSTCYSLGVYTHVRP